MRRRVALAAVAVVGVAAIVVSVVLVRRDHGLGDGGLATSATVEPSDVAVDSAGTLYIVDSYSRIRKVTPDGVISTIAGDDIPFNFDVVNISNVAVDAEGRAVFSDGGRLRRVGLDGTITTVAGRSVSCPLDHAETRPGRATAIGVCPYDVITDAAGNSYFVDLNYNNQSHVLKVTEAGDISPLDRVRRRSRPDCLEGSGFDHREPGDVGPVQPDALAIDEAGNLYVSDYLACQVLKVSADGVITVVAGSGRSVSSGDGGPAVDAGIVPGALAVDRAGNVYIVDIDTTPGVGNRVRRVSPDGVISTVAGNGSSAFSGDGGQAVDAGMSAHGIAVDRAGNLYIADDTRVRRVSPDGVVSTVAGDGSIQKSAHPPND